MTSDERLDRLEHVTAGLAEQWKKEREEDRALWRDTQRQINSISRKIADAEDAFLRHQEEQAERDKQLDTRFKQSDERVEKLVVAIGEWIAQGKK